MSKKNNIEKQEDKKKQEKDEDKKLINNMFIRNQKYPETDMLFTFQLKSLEDIKNDCYIVLDTNVLLAPYETSNKSLDVLKTIYKELIKNKKLIIPGQVVREFVDNRPKKISDLYKSLSNNKNKKPSSLPDIKTVPLFENINEYEELIKVRKKLNEELEKHWEKYKNAINKVLELIESWSLNDPISLVYKELFDKDVILDITSDKVDKNDLEWRKKNHLPPGYKDSDKEDGGVGDYLIWYTILKIAKEKKQSVIFVTDEQKNDWWHKADKETLYPRFELIDEFRRFSEGHSFHIINLSRLLELLKIDKEIIQEFRELREKHEKYTVNMNNLKERLGNATENFLGRELTPDLLESVFITLVPLKIEEFYTQELQKQFSEIIQEINTPPKRTELAKDKEKAIKIAENLFDLYKRVFSIENTELELWV
ncbi:MAG TPA: PIN domain-containing protein [Atribacterota bacterium]|nr:PIN domain-containing protein [Atribacterota bacterium]